MCVLFYEFPMNGPIPEFQQKQFKFHIQPYIIIAKFFLIFNMGIF